MVVISEDGGLALPVSISHARVDFVIKYRKGCQNGNADALSRDIPRNPAVAATQFSSDSIKKDIQEVQQADPILQVVYEAVQQHTHRPTSCQQHQSTLSRYCKLWSQLTLCEGVLCRQYTPQPLGTAVTVPILPKSLQRRALQQCHDSPSAGHQGFNKTLELLHKEAYWVSMISDVESYCR